MKRLYNIMMLAVVALVGLLLAACDNDDLNTDQYGGSITVNAFGPCPVLRGGTLFFYGSNLDQISEVDLPGADPITAIEVLERGGHSKISIQVPAENCEPGIIVLKTKKGGELQTVTPITYREDVKFTGFFVGEEGNLSGNVDDELTIKGDYLNLMHGVIFAENDTVKEDAFLQHDRYTIRVKIPAEARTGEIRVTDLAEEPTELASTQILDVKLPTVESLTPVLVKAGNDVTVKGGSLLQVVGIELNGANVKAEDFKQQSANNIVFSLPAEAADGEVKLVLKSGVEVPAGSIMTVVPTNLSATPSPVKNGATLTISGNDLDLVTEVVFPNADDAAKIESQSASELKVEVPVLAQDGDVALKLANGKEVKVAVKLVEVTVSSVAPEALMAGQQLVIKGKDLDLVASITFPADQTVEAADMKVTSQTIVVTIPGAAKGNGFVLTQKNGKTVKYDALTIKPSTDPTVNGMPKGNPGNEVKIEGTNYDNVEALYIGATKVTKIVQRTSTSMTFVIPSTVEAGTYDLIMKTSDGGSYTVGKIEVIPNEIDLSGNLVRTDDGSTKISLPLTLTWGDDGRFYVMKTGAVDVAKYNWTAGKSKLRLYIDPTVAGQAQINDYNWGNVFYIDSNVGDEYIEFTLTDYMVGFFTGASDGWGRLFIIQGRDMKIQKVVAIP